MKNKFLLGNKNVASENKLYKLEAIRGFAAIYVVLYHTFASGMKIFNQDFSFLFRFGQEAVILFFVLSGFVIYYSFDNSKNKTLKLFFAKRFLRIYIPLILVFITNYSLLCYYQKKIIDFSFKELIGNLLMLQDLGDKKPNVLVEPFLGNIPLWSLSYEWYFYFIFFFVYKKFRSNSVIIYCISIFAAILYVFYPYFVFRVLLYFSIWWVGVDFAKLYLKREKIDFNSVKLMLVSVLTICIILILNIIYRGAINSVFIAGGISEHPWIEFRHFLFTFLIIVFVVIWKKIKWFGFDFIFKPFIHIAPISFGIYISHWFLVNNANYFSFIKDSSVRLISYMIVCLFFSYLLELVFFPKIRKLIMNRGVFVNS